MSEKKKEDSVRWTTSTRAAPRGQRDAHFDLLSIRVIEAPLRATDFREITNYYAYLSFAPPRDMHKSRLTKLLSHIV